MSHLPPDLIVLAFVCVLVLVPVGIAWVVVWLLKKPSPKKSVDTKPPPL